MSEIKCASGCIRGGLVRGRAVGGPPSRAHLSSSSPVAPERSERTERRERGVSLMVVPGLEFGHQIQCQHTQVQLWCAS